jgi:hypothetical protein
MHGSGDGILPHRLATPCSFSGNHAYASVHVATSQFCCAPAAQSWENAHRLRLFRYRLLPCVSPPLLPPCTLHAGSLAILCLARREPARYPDSRSNLYLLWCAGCARQLPSRHELSPGYILRFPCFLTYLRLRWLPTRAWRGTLGPFST